MIGDSPDARRAERTGRFDRVRSLAPGADWHRSSYLVSALGVLFVLVATVHAGTKLVGGGSRLEAVLDLALIALPGLLLLYVGHWLSTTEFDPTLYPRIATWCVAGVAVMLVFVGLRSIHPGVTVQWTFGTRAIALSLGSVAGLAIGLYEARALTREQEVHDRNEELERTKCRLQDRNDELADTRAELRRIVEELEASNERLEQFTSVASHDLREPLRMVTSYLHLLEDGHGETLDEEASEYVALARDGATRMQTLIEDLREFSKVDATTEPFETVDLAAVVEDVRSDLQVRVEESGAQLTVDDLPRVQGDRSQLRQLLQNLVSNAIEYAGDEPPRVHVSAERRAGEQVVSVSDQGVGIDPADQERVFEAFQSLRPPDEHGGSGIGLAVCRRIADHHGGELHVESDVGEGSTFSVALPVAAEPADQRAASSPD